MRARQELGSLSKPTLASKTAMGDTQVRSDLAGWFGDLMVDLGFASKPAQVNAGIAQATTAAVAAGAAAKPSGDISLTDISVKSLGGALASLNPIDVMSAAASGFMQGVSSSSIAEAEAAGDKVNQTADGSGSISISDFKNVGGVCIPKNFPALAFAVTLQQQMNRVAAAKNFGRIAEDGKIGPGTMALFKKIQAAFPSDLMGDTSSCSYIAADADVLTNQVRQIADGLKAPAKVDPAPGAAAAIATSSGKTVIAPVKGGIGVAAVDGAIGGMSTGQKVVLAGLVGGIGYVLYKKSKKGSKKRRG